MARDTRFHVVDLAADRAGEPVVMLHGLFTGSIASWYLTSAPAISARRRVRLLDWRGHGLSERTRSGYGASAMADDLEALTADLPPFTIVGHSYGCAVGLRFLRTRPDRVRGMALIEPPLEGGARPAKAGLSLERLRELGQDTRSRRVRTLIERTTLLADLDAEPSITDEDLRALSDVPCMVVAGAGSPFAGAPERIRRVCPRIPGHLLEGGHDIHVTAASAVTALLTGFLEATVMERVHG
jgi:pimeloyl-ACP methyl ester carboxylesterase